MNVKLLEESGKIIFKHTAGSHMYGTNVSTSDIDTRGVFIESKDNLLSLYEPVQEVSDDSQDIKYYELKKFITLLNTANPTVIEMLWVPDDCVHIKTPIMDKLIENRNLFITAKAYHSHSGYAFAQIKRAQGKNKKVNNPQPIERPKREDFCWIIPQFSMDKSLLSSMNIKTPCRPIPVSNCQSMDLTHMHCSALEHVPNTYRLYYYGDEAKGVFRGDDMLVCESIPLEDELNHFVGILIYNQNEYDKAVNDWKSYHDWLKNRNDARWIDQENGKLNYDQKNMLHTFRLLYSGKNILTKGEPIVRFDGEQLEYLMDIRAGKFTYEALMEEVEGEMAIMEDLFKNTKLPYGVDHKKVDKLYRELMEM